MKSPSAEVVKTELSDLVASFQFRVLLKLICLPPSTGYKVQMMGPEFN